jgi:dolichol-phosphate mannosyltransferase
MELSRREFLQQPDSSRGLIVSVVVPVFNEGDGLPTFFDRTSAALKALPDIDYEIVFVDDGSVDRSAAIIKDFAARDSRVRFVKLSRNFGHQIAISAGIDHARGDCVVTIDADLQDPPEVIQELVAKWRDGFDIVYAVRRTRAGERALKLVTASAFYRLLNRMTNVEIPVDTGDFRLVSRRVADLIRGMREKDRFLRGLVSWLGFRHASVHYDRDRRFAGETKFPYKKMLRFAFDGITSFSTAPLKLATWLGYSASFLAFFYLASVLIQKFLGHTVQGWSSIMVAVLFLGGVQLICVGILGEYLGRVFNEIKPRPLYVVDEVVGNDSGATQAWADTRSDAPELERVR